MSLTLWTVIAPTPKNKTLGAFTTRHRERMLLQSADDWALRLHSCRALSSTIATRSYNKSFHNEITVDKPHTRNLWMFPSSGSIFRFTQLSDRRRAVHASGFRASTSRPNEVFSVSAGPK